MIVLFFMDMALKTRLCLQGTIETDTGKVELQFSADFMFKAASVYKVGIALSMQCALWQLHLCRALVRVWHAACDVSESSMHAGSAHARGHSAHD